MHSYKALIMFYKIAFPFSYFVVTRITRKEDIIFQFCYEWFPNLALVFFLSVLAYSYKNLLVYLIAYIAFISIYEIGYIFNDLVSVRNEKRPRRRLGPYTPTRAQFFVLLIIRVMTFATCSYALSKHYDLTLWWAGFGILALVYSLHNLIHYTPHKIITFLQLATLRIIIPIILLIPMGKMTVIMLGYILCYSIYRSFMYMEDKQILHLEDRRSMRYTVGYYSLLFPLLIFLCIFFHSFIPLIMGGYFVAIWLCLFGGKRQSTRG